MKGMDKRERQELERIYRAMLRHDVTMLHGYIYMATKKLSELSKSEKAIRNKSLKRARCAIPTMLEQTLTIRRNLTWKLGIKTIVGEAELVLALADPIIHAILR